MPDTNSATDVFLRNLQTNTTTRISDYQNMQAQGPSRFPRISADGMYIVFESNAPNLPGGTSSSAQVYRYEISTGALELVSQAGVGIPATGGDSGRPSVSADGRLIAFQSIATNLPDMGLGQPQQIFLRDMASTMPELVTVAPNSTPGDGPSQLASISADGSFIAFQSDAKNLVSNVTIGPATQVIGRNLQTGQNEVVSQNCSGPGTADSLAPSVSETGRFIAFHSTAAGLGAITFYDVLVRDRTFQCESVLLNVTPATSGEMFPSISDNGGFIAYHTAESQPSYPYIHVFTVDRVSLTTSQQDVDCNSSQANGPSGFPAISGDGLHVVFESDATNLVCQGSTTQGVRHVYVHGPQIVHATYCFGDGAGNGGPDCPCLNNTPIGAGEGCKNSTGVGARLNGTGLTSVSSDQLVLTVENLPINTFMIFLQGSAQHPTGVPLNDGLLCVTGNTFRFGKSPTGPTGAVMYPDGIPAGKPTVSGVEPVPATGGTRYYQAYYRNVGGPCLTNANLSNGLSVIWAP